MIPSMLQPLTTKTSFQSDLLSSRTSCLGKICSRNREVAGKYAHALHHTPVSPREDSGHELASLWEVSCGSIEDRQINPLWPPVGGGETREAMGARGIGGETDPKCKGVRLESARSQPPRLRPQPPHNARPIWTLPLTGHWPADGERQRFVSLGHWNPRAVPIADCTPASPSL